MVLAPLTPLLVLVFHSAPAIASRTHHDLLAALTRRANTSANASTGVRATDAELDSALVRKGSEEEDSKATPCACFLKEVETQHFYGGQNKIKFTDLDSEGHFGSLESCAMNCPQTCHNQLKYKFDPWEAQLVGAENVHVPMTASKCSYEGKCKCLDADTTTRRVNEYKMRERRHIDIAGTKWVYDTPQQCLQQCECGDRRMRSYWSQHEFEYDGLCVDEWRWAWFLYRNQFCYHVSPGVGLLSCWFTQKFKLKEDRSSGGHAYKVELDGLQDAQGHDVEKNIKLKVVKFEAETSTFYRTSDVKVGIKGLETSWKVYKSSVMSQRWTWTVEDKDGAVRYTINQQRWASLKGSVWKVYNGDKSGGRKIYYAYGNVDANAYKKGFEFTFYRDKGKTQFAGKLDHKVYDKKDDEDKYKVKVRPGEDAGLILITSVLIDKAFDAQGH